MTEAITRAPASGYYGRAADANRLGALSVDQIERCLRGDGLSLEVGGLRCLVQSDTGLLSAPLAFLYPHYRAATAPSGFYDVRMTLTKTRKGWAGERRVAFGWEGNSPFPELPLAQAHPMFEWGLNWCIATLSGDHTVIHSAVVERDGLAIVLPGEPGAGKSTLCAALSLSGWRLLSDELTIVSQTTGLVQPMPRPISLKSRSIDIVQSHFPQAQLSTPVDDTHKGSIAYVRPPDDAVDRWQVPARIGHIIFPRFAKDAELTIEPISRAQALAELMSHTFNVGLIGAEGFEALARAINGAACHAVEYPDLASITSWINTHCRSPD